jgi:D-ribulokinase
VDATCSLVVQGAPAGVGDADHPERDVIVWMDHRALEQAQRINAGGHAVLSYMGGVISPRWKRPSCCGEGALAGGVFRRCSVLRSHRLPDLEGDGFAAALVLYRDLQWTYLAHEGRWDADYFRRIGLGDLAEEGFARIGQEVVRPGTALVAACRPRLRRRSGPASRWRPD